MRERCLFSVVIALFLGGVPAAIWVAGSGRTPGYALDSNRVYRIEVGAVLAEEVSSALLALTERLERLEAGHRG
jgi:hypothetical protein